MAPQPSLFLIDELVERERRQILQKRVTFGSTLNLGTEQEQ